VEQKVIISANVEPNITKKYAIFGVPQDSLKVLVKILFKRGYLHTCKHEILHCNGQRYQRVSIHSLETLALYGFPKLAEIYSQTRSKCLEGSSFSFEEL